MMKDVKMVGTARRLINKLYEIEDSALPFSANLVYLMDSREPNTWQGLHSIHFRGFRYSFALLSPLKALPWNDFTAGVCGRIRAEEEAVEKWSVVRVAFSNAMLVFVKGGTEIGQVFIFLSLVRRKACIYQR